MSSIDNEPIFQISCKESEKNTWQNNPLLFLDYKQLHMFNFENIGKKSLQMHNDPNIIPVMYLKIIWLFVENMMT